MRLKGVSQLIKRKTFHPNKQHGKRKRQKLSELHFLLLFLLIFHGAGFVHQWCFYNYHNHSNQIFGVL